MKVPDYEPRIYHLKAKLDNFSIDTEEKIIEIFRDLAHKDDKIVIIVTHSRQVAEKADKILTLRRGKLS